MKKNSRTTGKLIFIGLVIGVLLIANLLIGGKLNDREYEKQKAVAQISQAAGGSFSLGEIYVAIPYTHTYSVVSTDGKEVECVENSVKKIPALSIDYKTKINTQMRTLGIYSSPVFNGTVDINCVFDISIPKNEDGYKYFPEKATMEIVLSEKSLVSKPVFLVNNSKQEVSYLVSDSYYYNILSSTFHCYEGKNTLDTILEIRGAEAFKVMLTSSESKVSVESDWISPGFSNYDYLPDVYDITDQGFSASWNLPFCSPEGKNYVGFDLVQTVDIYKMVHRAISYGFLFIIVPFIVLFLFDVFMKINFHPLHYLLSGAASVIFFLLLLSFSEHINFTLAYVISSLASGILVSFYVASVTNRVFVGFSMLGVFALMYIYLYFSLQSEDYALLIGSLFVFTILACVMFITRKVDWNNLVIFQRKDKNQDDSSKENITCKGEF
ncbi:MAG: inner membrane CreD family protein [Spirochaetaceae bacterium]|nr:inner membrane CreD family protein [Spirochaetaceae bacterium]